MQNNSICYKNKRTNFVDKALTVLICALLVIAVLRFAFSVAYFKVYVVGPSMNSTLQGAPDKYSTGGDYVYVFRSSSPRRGDIVIINAENKINGKRKTIIKRVIALGDDTVEIRNGVLYLNGEVKDEPYVLPKNNYAYDYSPRKVPAGHIFCMGDNRNNSTDSREEEVYGCIPVSDIVGVVAEWSLTLKEPLTAFNTFIDFTLPNAFGIQTKGD